MILVKHWEYEEVVYKLDLSKEDFYLEAARVAGCDPIDIKVIWEVIDLDSMETTTVENMWRNV